jgi:hypothetical protein
MGYDGSPLVPIEETLTRPSTSRIGVIIKEEANVLEVQVQHPKGKKPRPLPDGERFDLEFNFGCFNRQGRPR